MAASKPSKSLLALSAAAAALPGYPQAEELATAAYRYSHYSERELPAPRNAAGQPAARYEIETHQVQSEFALPRDWALSTELMVETMSGASPWFVVPDSEGAPVQVLSGATIADRRTALYARARQTAGRGPRSGLAAGVSREDDYLALSLGAERQWELDQMRSTVTAGGGVSEDRLRPTDGASARFPDRIRAAQRRSLKAYVGYARVLTPRSVAQISLWLGHNSGFLSDPYKLVFVEGRTAPDSRPGRRIQVALSGRYRHHVPALATSLRADWRHFRDDWGIVSDTLELGSWHRVAPRWRLGAGLRWYQQSQADFYAAYFNAPRADGRHSSDYRLSPFGALSARFNLDFFAGPWSLSAAAERYDSSPGYAPRRVDVSAPGLVDFTVLSLAVSYRFDGGRPLVLDPGGDGLRVVEP